MKIEHIDISKLKLNENNPRIIRDEKFKKLVQSIKDFPKMLEIRPIVVDSDMIVLGGNMRLKASQEAGLTKVPIIVADELSEDQKKEFIIKDNVGFGEWDWEMITDEWENEPLDEWGLDIPKMNNSLDDFEEPKTKDLWFLNIEFENEQELQNWYDKLIAEGLICKIVQ